jgi:gas vesicle protein
MKEELTIPTKQNSILVPMLVGGIVGAALGLLLAPKPGRETRKQIKDLAIDTKQKFSSAIDRSREFLDEAKVVVSNAVDAGKQAYAEEREKYQMSH